jgi:hypothetical protein
MKTEMASFFSWPANNGNGNLKAGGNGVLAAWRWHQAAAGVMSGTSKKLTAAKMA